MQPKMGLLDNPFSLISSGMCLFSVWRKGSYFWDHQPQMFYELKICPAEWAGLVPLISVYTGARLERANLFLRKLGLSKMWSYSDVEQ